LIGRKLKLTRSRDLSHAVVLNQEIVFAVEILGRIKGSRPFLINMFSF